MGRRLSAAEFVLIRGRTDFDARLTHRSGEIQEGKLQEPLKN